MSRSNLLGVILGLVLVLGVSASGFQHWYDYAGQQGNPKLVQSVRVLEFREPILLANVLLWELAMEAVGEGRKAAQQDQAQRSLSILRMEYLFKDERLRNSLKALAPLYRKDRKAWVKLCLKTRPTQLNEADLKSAVVNQVETAALYLEVDMKLMFELHRSRAFACWSNQKVLQGAWELARLDFPNAKLKREILKNPEVTKLLKTKIRDPGHGPGSISHYLSTAQEKVFCTQHGFGVPPVGVTPESTPRDQLFGSGEKSEELLDLCSELPIVPLVMRGDANLIR